MGRAPCCEKVGLRRGRWTAEEDQILSNYVQAHGEGSWRSLPKNAGLLRCGKSCRLRWINYLRSDVKRGNISAEEEDMIMKLHASLGNRWSLIAGHLAGRTDNEIKNYWNSHLSRKLFISSSSKPPISAGLSVNKGRGGRTSRSATKMKIKKADKTSSRAGQNPIMPPSTPAMEKESNSICMDGVIVDSSSSSSSSSRNELDDCFNEIFDDECLLLMDPTEQKESDVVEERRNGIEVIDITTGGEEVKNSGSAGSSTNDTGNHGNQQLDWEWNWDFEGGSSIVGLELGLGLGGEEDDDNILSWPWENPTQNNGEDDDFAGVEVDTEKQNAMIEWLLS